MVDLFHGGTDRMGTADWDPQETTVRELAALEPMRLGYPGVQNFMDPHGAGT